MAESIIRSRINSDVKLEAQALLEKFGLTMSEAIRLFLHQVVIEKGLPFQVRLPSDAAKEHDSWVRSQINEALIVAEDPATEFLPHDAVNARWIEKKKALQDAATKGKRS
jgi:DNA-damage-inducible protein J